jgi:hypothetical protein
MKIIIFLSLIILLVIIRSQRKKKRRKNGVQILKKFNRGASAKAKENFYRANSDVIDAMEIRATLQFRTCLVCGAIDGRRYGFNDTLPKLPLHEGCRCVLLPVTPFSDFIEKVQPAEMVPVAYFAEQRYNASGKKKRFAELAESTRKKYCYAEEKILMSQGVKVWRQFNGNYQQWFYSLPPEYQKIILGDYRFELMQKMDLSLSDFVDVDNLREYTIDELKQRYQY